MKSAVTVLGLLIIAIALLSSAAMATPGLRWHLLLTDASGNHQTTATWNDVIVVTYVLANRADQTRMVETIICGHEALRVFDQQKREVTARFYVDQEFCTEEFSLLELKTGEEMEFKATVQLTKNSFPSVGFYMFDMVMKVGSEESRISVSASAELLLQ